MLRLERTFGRDAEVGGLLGREGGKLHPDLVQVQACDLFVQLFGQHVHRWLVRIAVLPEVDLCEDLVGEARGHHEAGVTCGATQIHETAFRQHENLVPVRETVFVDLGLDVDALHAFSFVEEVDLDFVVEMADVRDDRLILHRLHMFEGDDIHVARGGDVNISPTQRFLVVTS